MPLKKTLTDGTKVSWRTRTENTNKGYRLLSPLEIDAENIRNAKAEEKAEGIEALALLEQSDAIMPRWAEELILGELSPETIEKAEAKRELRARLKPKLPK